MVKLCKYCNKEIKAGKTYCSKECYVKDRHFIIKLNEDISFKRVKNLTHTCLHCKKKISKGQLCLCFSPMSKFKTYYDSLIGTYELEERNNNKRIPIYIHIDCIKSFCESLNKFKEDNSEHLEELQLKLIERNI